MIIKNGIPSIGFTPCLEPIPNFNDNETVSFPTKLIESDFFRSSSASCSSTYLSW